MGLRAWEYAIRESAVSIRRNGLMSLAAVSTIGLALLILATFLTLAANLQHMAGYLEAQVEIRAFLRADAAVKVRDETQQAISALPGVTKVTFVSREEALKRLRQQFGEQQGVLDAVEEMNPLPDGFEIKVDQPESVEKVAAAVEKLPGIEKVKYQQGLVQRLFRLTQAVRTLGIALAAALAAATLFIISNTIRLTVFARRREVAIMKLVGATDAFIRRPFFLEGLALGVVGAVVAALAIWLSYSWLVTGISLSLPFIPLVSRQPFLANLSLVLVVLGAIIGAGGTLFSLKRYLKV
ncbi:MAG: permease-like cell division protein FtsX [Firmicutes bacterium]|nr:permease-like cell division protein FtsX [Bacillota bacterium]MCL5039558.1 permease-like cell division protein FtsX [Bacillota bacterium]